MPVALNALTCAGDYLRIWQLKENGTHLIKLLNNVRASICPSFRQQEACIHPLREAASITAQSGHQIFERDELKLLALVHQHAERF